MSFIWGAILKSWYWWFIAVLEKSPKVKLSIYINVFLRWVWDRALRMASAAGTLNPQLFQIMTVFGMISDNGGVWKYLQIIARVGLGTVLLDYVPNVPNIQLCPNSMHTKQYSLSALRQTDKVGSCRKQWEGFLHFYLIRVKHSSTFKRTTLNFFKDNLLLCITGSSLA